MDGFQKRKLAQRRRAFLLPWYHFHLSEKGLNLLCTPGNDVESTTAMAGSGANMIIFTTGLGTPTGNPITPVIKVSSNSTVYHKMKDIIDFDTGSIIEDVFCNSAKLSSPSTDCISFLRS